MALLARYDIGRIYSSPFARCVQTVAPLAAACGLIVEPTEALAEGSRFDALDLVRADVTVLCGHGDTVPDMLVALGADWTGTCKKASTWVVEFDPKSATHLPPPD